MTSCLDGVGEHDAPGPPGSAQGTPRHPGSAQSAEGAERRAQDPPTNPVLVILVGVPGAGKTTVGTALALALGVPFRDTDADVEASTGRLIADIFVESGEAEFRRLEAAAVATALAEHEGVLALGGGAVLDPATRDLLRGRPVVWLRVGLAAASRRAGLSNARPLLFGNLRAQLKALMDARDPLYAEVAVLTIDTDELPRDEAVVSIVHELGMGPVVPPAVISDDAIDGGAAAT